MEKLFEPKFIAVIGASRKKDKLGYQILENIIKNGYKGKIFPVNPEADAILNLKCYSKITDIEENVDLAIVIVPAKIVPPILEECALKKVAYAVVISSGFSEIGDAGKKLQDEILNTVVSTTPLRVVGPNCLGVVNTAMNLNATFAAPEIYPGHVSVIFQSGAMGVAAFDLAKKYEFGFAKFIALGNKVDLEEAEILDYLADDPDTKVIAIYLEQVTNLSKFLISAKRASSKKPVIILKGGVTYKGAKAAFSHTAAMITSNHINKAVFSQANLIVAKTIDEMLNYIQIFSHEPLPQANSLAIVTNAGGPGILATDVASRFNIKLPETDPKTIKRLQKSIKNISSLQNPFDLTGTALAKDYELVIKEIIADSRYGSILVILTPQTMTEVSETAKVLAKYANAPKPIVASFLGDKTIEEGKEILRKYGVPHFEDPEIAIEAISKIIRYSYKRNSAEDTIELPKNDTTPRLIGDALELISSYDIPIPPSGVATNIDVAMKIVGRIGLPVAIKNISNKIVHKFKAGKVILNVQNETFVKTAIDRLGFPVLIQRMVESPFEIIIGAKRDKALGVMITFGWGGVFTEDLADISTRILPLTEFDLDEMIKETKIGKILVREKIDLSNIKNTLINVCQIMTDYPEITEVDLNPLKISDNTAMCVDARYKIGK